LQNYRHFRATEILRDGIFNTGRSEKLNLSRNRDKPFKQALMTLSLEKLLSPGVTGMINRLLKEKHVLWYINYFTKS